MKSRQLSIQRFENSSRTISFRVFGVYSGILLPAVCRIVWDLKRLVEAVVCRAVAGLTVANRIALLETGGSA
jgi:hypothetical protein